jgi:branched-chain amino acid transport system substrate-binding protein
MKRILCGLALGLLCLGLFGTPLASAGDIKVGIIDELSGSGAGWGNRHVNGYKIAFDEINKAGGVKGIGKFKLIIEDSGSNPSQAVNAAKKLIFRDKVDVLMACCNSSTTLAVLPTQTKAEVPNLNSCSSSKLITQKGSEWIFRTQIVSARSLGGMINFAIDTLGSKKPVVWNDTNEYGRAAAEGALEKLKERGITPVAHLTHTTKDKIFTPQLMKMKELGADTIISAIYYEEMSLILKQAKDLGVKFQVVATDVLGTPVFFDLAGELANGIHISLLFSPDDPDPKAQAFVKKVKAEYGVDAGQFEAMGYDAAYILWDAISRAGSVDKVKIRDALRTSAWEGLCGKTEFSPEGDDVKAFLVCKLMDGKYIPVKRQK